MSDVGEFATINICHVCCSMFRAEIKGSYLGALKRVRRGTQILAGHGEEAGGSHT